MTFNSNACSASGDKASKYDIYQMRHSKIRSNAHCAHSGKLSSGRLYGAQGADACGNKCAKTSGCAFFNYHQPANWCMTFNSNACRASGDKASKYDIYKMGTATPLPFAKIRLGAHCAHSGKLSSGRLY